MWVVTALVGGQPDARRIDAKTVPEAIEASPFKASKVISVVQVPGKSDAPLEEQYPA